MNKPEFAEWMKKQLRLAGEELIRRSETINFDGWDGVQNISVNIDIPTRTESIEVPKLDIYFTVLNRVAIDDLIAEGHNKQLLTTDNGRPIGDI